jgi:hypothetical protein
MKIIPIINIEDKLLWIPKIDWVVFLLGVVIVEFFKSLAPFIFGWKFGDQTLYGAFGLFIVFEIMKHNLEKKEQNLFIVLFHNARIPNIIIGSFWRKTFLGVKGEIKS